MEVVSANLVTVSCADHNRFVAIALRNLFDSKRGTDFDFRLGEKSVRAHRLIVELFLTPESTGTVQDEPIGASAVKQEVPDDGQDDGHYGSNRNILDFVMEFMYKGEVSVPEQQLEDLLGVAKELDFQMLIDAVHVRRQEDEPNAEATSELYSSDHSNDVGRFIGPQIEDVQLKRATSYTEPTLQLKYAKYELDDASVDSKTHAPKLKCPHCDFETFNRSTYQNHCMSVHGLTTRGQPAPVHKCPKCDYSSAYVGSLNKHLSTKHSEERSHACPQCSYVAKLKYTLKRHLSVVHGVGGSRFTCSVCGRRCDSRVLLETHARIHTNERPFKCPHCSFDSNHEMNLKRHLYQAH